MPDTNAYVARPEARDADRLAVPARTARTLSMPPGGQVGTVDRWGRLMSDAQRGNQEAYDLLLGELDGWLRRFYAKRLPREAVEDAVQDALLAAHANRHSYTPSRPFGPWISAIARYKWVDRIREESRFRTVELKQDIAVADSGNAIAASLAVQELLKMLKPSQADAIRVVKLEGETIEGASRKTGQSEALVKVNVHRGLKKLSALLNPKVAAY